MSKVLNLDEMLECLCDLKHPAHDDFKAKMEEIGTQMANVLATQLEVNTTGATSEFSPEGKPSVHGIYEGCPDIREHLSDRMAAAFYACKGFNIQALRDGIIHELIYAVKHGDMEAAKSFAAELKS